MVSSRVEGRQDGVLLRRDTSHHALKDELSLVTAAERIAGEVLAYNDGERCAEVV